MTRTEREEQDRKACALIADLNKQKDQLASVSTDPERQRYYQQIHYTSEDLFNLSAAAADSSGEGGCIR